MTQAARMTDPVYDDWVGRTETREGGVTPNLAGMLTAAVSHDLSARHEVRAGMEFQASGIGSLSPSLSR